MHVGRMTANLIRDFGCIFCSSEPEGPWLSSLFPTPPHCSTVQRNNTCKYTRKKYMTEIISNAKLPGLSWGLNKIMYEIP